MLFRSYYAPKQALILPLSYSTFTSSSKNEWFNGFQVFTVSAANGIKEGGRVKHADQYCFNVYLQPRSFIFNDQVVTLKAQSIQSYDWNNLVSTNTTVTEQWKQELGTVSNRCF